MNTCNNLISHKSNISALASADAEVLNTLKEFRSFAGLPLTDDAVERINSVSPIFLNHPVELTMAMIISRYLWLCTESQAVEFSLSSHALLKLVEELDMLPKSLGFYYREVFQRECALIVPREFSENTPLWQLVVPLQRWRINLLHLHCPMLGTALILSLMHRLIRDERCLSAADWTPLIMVVAHAPVYQLGIAVNDAVLAIIEKCKKE